MVSILKLYFLEVVESELPAAGAALARYIQNPPLLVATKKESVSNHSLRY